MKRILAASCTVLSILCACNGSSGLPFSVDTAQLKHFDSVAAEQRHTDSVLLQQAGRAPGINAGAGKFTVSTPPGWRRVDTLIGNIRGVMLDTASARTGFRTNISIVSDSLRGLSPDKYFAGAINSFGQFIPQFSLVGKGARQIAGRSANWVHYSQKVDGTELENICYIVTDNGVAYIITCSAIKGGLLQNYSAFERTVRSFKLN
jgi:hypothetical protein